MQFNELGKTGIRVSKICLGTMTYGEQNTEKEAHEQMDYADSQGVNFFDTAEMYPIPPRSETYTKTEQIIGNCFLNIVQQVRWQYFCKIPGHKNQAEWRWSVQSIPIKTSLFFAR